MLTDEKKIFIEIASHTTRLVVCYHLSFGPMGFDELQKQLNVDVDHLKYHIYDKKHLVAEGIVKENNGKYYLNVSPLMVDFVRGFYIDDYLWERVEMLEYVKFKSLSSES